MRAGSLRAQHKSALKEARSLLRESRVPPLKKMKRNVKNPPCPSNPARPAPSAGLGGQRESSKRLPEGAREQKLLPALLWKGAPPVGTERLTPFILPSHIKKRIGEGEEGSFHCWEAVGRGRGGESPQTPGRGLEGSGEAKQLSALGTCPALGAGGAAGGSAPPRAFPSSAVGKGCMLQLWSPSPENTASSRSILQNSLFGEGGGVGC